jgi:hypothetical protein
LFPSFSIDSGRAVVMAPKGVVVVVEQFCQLLCGYFFDRHRISFLDQLIVRSALRLGEQSEFKTFSCSASLWFLSLLPTRDFLFSMAESETGPVTDSMRSALLAQRNKES